MVFARIQMGRELNGIVTNLFLKTGKAEDGHEKRIGAWRGKKEDNELKQYVWKIDREYVKTSGKHTLQKEKNKDMKARLKK